VAEGQPPRQAPRSFRQARPAILVEQLKGLQQLTGCGAHHRLDALGWCVIGHDERQVELRRRGDWKWTIAARRRKNERLGVCTRFTAVGRRQVE
jgi:hypothetical protein